MNGLETVPLDQGSEVVHALALTLAACWNSHRDLSPVSLSPLLQGLTNADRSLFRVLADCVPVSRVPRRCDEEE